MLKAGGLGGAAATCKEQLEGLGAITACTDERCRSDGELATARAVMSASKRRGVQDRRSRRGGLRSIGVLLEKS